MPIRPENKRRRNDVLSDKAREARAERGPETKCAHCGGAFRPYLNRLARFCSSVCRKAAGRHRVTQQPKLCTGCGLSFTPRRSAKSAYCTSSCKARHYNRLTKADPTRAARKRESERRRWKGEAYRHSQRDFKARRRAAEREGGVSRDQWRVVVGRFGGVCAYCRRPGLKITMDHVVALSKGGSHAPHNVVPACQSCNSAKRDRDWSEKLACL